MKKVQSSLAVKIAAVLLLIIFLVTTVLSICGIMVVINENVYLDNGRKLRTDVLNYLCEREKEKIEFNLWAITLDDSGEHAKQWEEQIASNYLPENSNYRFTITDEAGKTLFNNGSCQDAQVSYDYEVNVDKIYGKELRLQRVLVSIEAVEDFLMQFGKKNEILWYSTYEGEEPTDAVDQQEIIGYTQAPIAETERGKETVILDLTYQKKETTTFLMHAAIPTELTARDHIYYTLLWTDRFIDAWKWVIILGAVALLLSITLSVFLLYAAGHKAGVEGIYLNWLNRIPFDLQLAVWTVIAVWIPAIFDIPSNKEVKIMLACIIGISWAGLFLSAVLSFAARVKNGAWWRNTLVFRILHYGKRAFLWFWRGMSYASSKLPLFWKTLLAWLTLTFLELIFLLGGAFPVLWVLEKILLTPVLILLVLNLRKLQAGGERIAHGAMEQPVDLQHMLPVFRMHGENLNSINIGMQRAVDARMHSERMRAELITNVSHDIKTPLTSIVNYVDLLKKDGLSSPQAAEYLEVLDRQSMRLKKLTEDLIEASKAATGNIAVHMEQTDLHVLLSQAVGEYGEKLQARHLELVYDLRAESAFVEADGRLLWRVFDNLMNNICKYALEGTRVYLRTVQSDGNLTVTFLNISCDALNISGEELMERFVRGDVSRNTEGSGLGLSIAKSLTELQHGRFEISVEGDLFKSTLIFPMS